MAEKLPIITHYVRVRDDLAIALTVHVLPREDGSYSWFGSRHSQELMVLAHEVTYARATSMTAERPKYEFRRSDSLRALLTFKPNESRQHVLVLNDDSHSPLLPCAGSVTDFGRSVLPYLDSATTTGSGYKPFRLCPDTLHAYVDPFELGNPQGIFKIRSLLDPSHKCSLDIASYFVRGTGGEEGVLPEVPVSGLRRQTGKKRTGRERMQLSRRQTRASAQRMAVRPPQHQPTIAQSFANVQLRSVGTSLGKDVGVYGEDLPLSAIDEFLDFGSQDGGGRDPPIIILPDDVRDPDATLPLSPQVHSSASDEEYEIQRSRKKQKLTSPRPAANKRNTKSTSSSLPIQHSSTLPKSTSHQTSSDMRTDSAEQASTVRASSIQSKDLSLRRKRLQSVDDFDSSVPDTPASEKERNPLCCSSEEVFADELPAEADTVVTSDGNGEECTQTDEPSQSDLVDACLFDLATPPLLSPKASPRQLRNKSKVNVDSSLCDTVTKALFDITNSPEKRPASIFAGHTPLQKVLSLCDGQTNINSYLADEVAPSSSTASFAETINEVILISSGEDSPVKSQEGETQRAARQKIKKKKKKAFDFKELIKNKRSIKDLSQEDVRRWLRQKRDLLVRLFLRKEYSWRHEDYVAGAKKRASLQYQIDTRMFTQGQIDVITDCLMKVFCGRHMKFFSYTMSVLFPECLVRLIADFHNVDFDEADVMMCTYKNDKEEVEISDDDLN